MLNGGNVASPRRTEGVEVLKWWKVVVSLKIQETQNVIRRVCFFGLNLHIRVARNV